MSVGWNNFYEFGGLSKGSYLVITSIDKIVSDINVVINGVYTQVGVSGQKNGTLLINVINDNTNMLVTAYTNTATTEVTLQTSLIKVA